MKRLTLILAFCICLTGSTLLAQSSSGLSNVQAIQSAELALLKNQIKLLTETLKETKSEMQKKVDSLSADLAVAKSAAAAAQSSANAASSAATTARSAADRAINASAAAQSTANSALANTSNPVLMIGAETGRRWSACPPGYLWIGGFNNDTTIAYPEMNRWHPNYSWRKRLAWEEAAGR